ncbi:hypothetical protein [Methylobacterium symbioticum]|uniref:Uncharacterized protein n=1 Tax=Methylobacterium symbioticum TaxID=2584084 RepID=A0A509E629_9HYPH|nr:hypothetical protein [Methylobacterium symbioticum]VUD69542.1 hypothetical protein MET9862_00093 [Methylobacterium symbioticum]
MDQHALLTRAIRGWGQALAAAEAGSAAALGPSSRRAALVIGNSVAMGAKSRRILAEAVESSLRLAAEREAAPVFALRLDARAKFEQLRDRLDGMRTGPGATPHKLSA